MAVLDRVHGWLGTVAERLPRREASRRLMNIIRPVRDRSLRATGPEIFDFAPPLGRAGCSVSIIGINFSDRLIDNSVEVGGRPARVVAATTTDLTVLTDIDVMDGPVVVSVAGIDATSTTDFRVLSYPTEAEDGPPIRFAGAGEGNAAGQLPATGTTRVLVALVHPTDRVPAPGSTARQTVVDRWNTVNTYYDEASFSTKEIAPDVMASWTSLTGATADYVDFSASVRNVKPGALPRLYAEAAKAAQDAGFNLNDYGQLAVTLFLNGDFIRAWNSGQAQTFSYDPGPGGTKISITLTNPINRLAVQETANWGRLAHEVGHGLVDAPAGLPNDTTKNGTAVFGEDIYTSDLVDPGAATADAFDLMGDHDAGPLLSAFHMEQLSWYRPDNPAHDQDILDLTWDRNSFRQEYEIVAHGGTRNSVANRYHSIKIKVAAGLFYYIEVRQRPGTTVFDPNIPVAGSAQQGGVVVTKVITDIVNNNQQFRFLTLLHDKNVLKTNDTAVDPARDLTITVLDDDVVARPLVCRVRVEWARNITGDPSGTFDLSIAPWDTSSYTSPDIWVDRKIFGTFDQPLDSQGRPQLNGDKPKPKEINKIFARVSCSGVTDATNVKVTYYTVEPPGVGDNGNWAPLITRTVGHIAAGAFVDVTADWVSRVGRHTCLKVFVSQQLGEISGGNNSAQENVFDFEAPAFSPPAPVVTTVAVRNPLDEASVVAIDITGVPRGYAVHFPHAWVNLEAREERQFDLVVIPTLDISAYVGGNNEVPALAPVVVHGSVPRQYDEPMSGGDPPASTVRPIGGILSRVRPVRATEVEITSDPDHSSATVAGIAGTVRRAVRGDRVRVVVRDERGQELVQETRTDGTGAFVVRLDLSELAVLAGRDPRDVAGTYVARAHTFAASTVSEAESRTLTIVR